MTCLTAWLCCRPWGADVHVAGAEPGTLPSALPSLCGGGWVGSMRPPCPGSRLGEPGWAHGESRWWHTLCQGTRPTGCHVAGRGPWRGAPVPSAVDALSPWASSCRPWECSGHCGPHWIPAAPVLQHLLSLVVEGSVYPGVRVPTWLPTGAGEEAWGSGSRGRAGGWGGKHRTQRQLPSLSCTAGALVSPPQTSDVPMRSPRMAPSKLSPGCASSLGTPLGLLCSTPPTPVMPVGRSLSPPGLCGDERHRLSQARGSVQQLWRLGGRLKVTPPLPSRVSALIRHTGDRDHLGQPGTEVVGKPGGPHATAVPITVLGSCPVSQQPPAAWVQSRWAGAGGVAQLALAASGSPQWWAGVRRGWRRGQKPSLLFRHPLSPRSFCPGDQGPQLDPARSRAPTPLPPTSCPLTVTPSLGLRFLICKVGSQDVSAALQSCVTLAGPCPLCVSVGSCEAEHGADLLLLAGAASRPPWGSAQAAGARSRGPRQLWGAGLTL